ncbi:uncharacterized protein LOC117330737 [Pecten maximus]|uniref:uncharacterized protein LOC117330737 n=1 Tax=Pecten maximus TaxID=6579 RepID=UPI0014581EA3|nr:uncharacterized protein LOC117330737 [Pecten maximus]XP_033745084.1 uncharacterized protein LOC117330737 [Pecten maximus]
MPRRILSDSHKGWSGWESRFNAALRMSKSSMFSTRVKNEQEGNRLSMKLRHIRKTKQKTENVTNRDIKETKDDFIKIIASGQVYRKHRFEKYDPYLKDVREHRTVVVDKFRDIKKATKNIRLANMIAKGRLLDLAPIPEESGEISIGTRRESLFHPLDQSSTVGLRRPSINNSIQMNNQGDRAFSASSRLTDFGSVRSEQLRVKEYSHRRIKRKAKTIIMSRDRTIFPGECKSTYEMRKFMAKEATDFIYSFSPEGRRQAQIDKLKREAQLPEFVDRTKSTSAILRHYQEYKSNRSLLEPI